MKSTKEKYIPHWYKPLDVKLMEPNFLGVITLLKAGEKLQSSIFLAHDIMGAAIYQGRLAPLSIDKFDDKIQSNFSLGLSQELSCFVNSIQISF